MPSKLLLQTESNIDGTSIFVRHEGLIAGEYFVSPLT